MSLWDDITVGLGNAANAIGLGDVGLVDGNGQGNFQAEPIHLPGVPVQPSADMTDADIRAWRLQNVGAFNTGGLSVDANGDLGLLTGYNPLTAPGALVPSPSQEFSKSIVGSVTGIGDSLTAGLKTVAIGAGVLIGLLIILELVKR